MEEFTLAQARALAEDWHCGSGPLYELASSGRVTCVSTLLTEVEGCLADLQGLHSAFPDDDVIVGDWSQMKRFRMWVERHGKNRACLGARPAPGVRDPAVGGSLPAAWAQDVLAGLATTVVVAGSPSDRSLDDALELARAAVPGCAGVGVALWDAKGAATTLAATSPVVRLLDGSQAELGEGPLPDAFSARTARAVPDLRAEGSWPRLAARAAGLGVAGATAVPLRLEPGAAGALSVYTRDVGALTADAQRLVMVHAEQVSAVLRGGPAARVLTGSLSGTATSAARSDSSWRISV